MLACVLSHFDHVQVCVALRTGVSYLKFSLQCSQALLDLCLAESPERWGSLPKVTQLLSHGCLQNQNRARPSPCPGPSSPCSSLPARTVLSPDHALLQQLIQSTWGQQIYLKNLPEPALCQAVCWVWCLKGRWRPELLGQLDDRGTRTLSRSELPFAVTKVSLGTALQGTGDGTHRTQTRVLSAGPEVFVIVGNMCSLWKT